MSRMMRTMSKMMRTTGWIRRSLPFLVVAAAFVLAPRAVHAQGLLCDPNMPPVAGGLDDLATTQQVNGNFDALVRSFNCLQRALQLTEASLRSMEVSHRAAMQEIALLRQQSTTTSPSAALPPREITIRACESATGDLVYLPTDIGCGRLGESYSDVREELPAFQVLAP